MWLIDKWENWSRQAYDVWGSKLQKEYDFWKDYDDPEIRKKCQDAWAKLSPGMQKSIYNLLVETLKKYGPEFAKKLMVKLSEIFVQKSNS